MMTIIDTHVHLQDAQYAPDLAAVLARAAQAGVRAAIVPGTTLADSRTALALVRRVDAATNRVGTTPEGFGEAPGDASAATGSSGAASCRLYAAVGIHPTEAYQLNKATLAELVGLAQSPGVVAIGEIGLDYYWPKISDRGWVCAEPAEQRRALEQQLALASQLHLPVVVHDRDAHEDTLSILEAWKAADPQARGTLHAYAAGPELLDRALALGFYIGIDGPVTYKKAARVHAVAQRVPLERLLLETDGPYLPPVPHRGKRNEPGYLPLIAAAVAALRNTTAEAVAATTADNAVELFDLPD